MKLRNNAIIKFFKEARVELSKVAWPSRAQAIRMTTIVITAILIAALIVGLIDFGLSKVLELVVVKK